MILLHLHGIDRTLNSSPTGQNGRHFEDDIFNHIVLNENIIVLLQMALKLVPTGPIDINLVLV